MRGRRMGFVLALMLMAVPALAENAGLADAFSGGLLVVERDGLWGLADASGALVQPVAHQNETVTDQGYVIALRKSEDGERYGAFNGSGEIVVPFEWDSLWMNEGSPYFFAEKGGRYGLLDIRGQVLLEPVYEEISPVRNDRVAVARNVDGEVRWGVMGVDGSEVLPLAYEEIQLGEGGEMLVREGGLWGYMDAAGRYFIPPRFDDAQPFKGDYAVVKMRGQGTFLSELEEGSLWEGLLYGLVDRSGREVVPCAFYMIYFASDGWRILNRGGASMCLRAENGAAQFYYVHADGTEERLPDWAVEWGCLIPLDSEPKRYFGQTYSGETGWWLINGDGSVQEASALEYLDGFSQGVAVVCLGGKYGYIRENGEWLVAPSLNFAKRFWEGLAAVENDAGQWGYLDLNGQMAIDFQFDSAYGFQDGYAQVGMQEGGSGLCFGLIDVFGNVVIPMEYDELITDSDDGTITAIRGEVSQAYRVDINGATPVASVGSDILLEDYMPFTGSKVAQLSQEATLQKRASAAYGHPRLDGATALFPVYSAFVQAVYPEKTRYGEAEEAPLVTCTKTNRAYERLIEGEADIIFCAGPSEAQLASARAAGVAFELTPIGKEAFVFIVNRQNPLENLSLNQIRGIYSGQITQWSELGVDALGEIIAYQRPANSGSQTALERLMGDTPIMEAPQERISNGMDDIVQNVEYRNLANALGYSFRFYCTEMMDSDIKLLSIDGVAPTVENIRNGSYPITTTLYAVSRAGEENPNVQALLDWVVSPQGQELVEASGYVAYAP